MRNPVGRGQSTTRTPIADIGNLLAQDFDGWPGLEMAVELRGRIEKARQET